LKLSDRMAKMNKVQLNVTVSEDAKQKAEQYGSSGGYGSTSNFVESAIWYYIGSLNRENEFKLEECKKELIKAKEEAERNSSILLKILMKHPELISETNEQSD